MVVHKTKIVGQLAGKSLLLPDLVAEALASNARIKYALSWLQMAEDASRTGSLAAMKSLEPERVAAGLGTDPLYQPPATTRRAGDAVEVPHAGAIVARLIEDLARMRVTTEAGAAAGTIDGALAANFRAREDAIRRMIHLEGDALPSGFVTMISRPPRDGIDSLHGLVMDMHRALNAIAVDLAEEDIAGAKVYRLSPDDKLLVAAFMRGLNRTSPLKFDHPGLATNAMRDGTRLVVQNDIGTTDAHVLIAQIEGRRLSITYSDIHRPRLEFFLQRLPSLSWTVTDQRATGFEDDIFYVATGVLDAPDTTVLKDALERLGANIVFLIDWNKARKSLRRLVSKSEARSVLEWAAEKEIGHRGYLEIGGDILIADLLETASKATGGFYTSLGAAVGPDCAADFLKEVLRLASEGLRKGRSPIAIRDTLRAELLARVASVSDRIVDVALDHSALMLDLGNLVRRAILERRAAPGEVAARAKRWEALADDQVRKIRELCGSGHERSWREIASAADDAADSFEETAFRLQFLSGDIAEDVRGGLLILAEHAVSAVKDYVRLLSAFRNVHRGASREDMRNFLDFSEKLHEQEHATDEAERDVFACLMHTEVDAKTFAVVTAIADGLEEAGDALLRTAHLITDHALGEWFAA